MVYYTFNQYVHSALIGAEREEFYQFARQYFAAADGDTIGPWPVDAWDDCYAAYFGVDDAQDLQDTQRCALDVPF